MSSLNFRLVLLHFAIGVASLSAQQLALAFKPVGVGYSSSLDRLIIVSANPNQVHVVNPANGLETTINLSLTPLSVSVSTDGSHAAVGHDGWISYVNLSAGYVEKNLAVSYTASTVILTGNGTVWVPPTANINIATGVQNSSGYSPWQVIQPALHPNGKWIYYTRGGYPDDVIKNDVSTGTSQYLYDSKYHGDFPVCAGIFYSADGNRLLTGCGTFFRTTASSTDDLSYNGSLSATTTVAAAADSAITHKFAVVPRNYNGLTVDTELQFYDNQYLTLLGRVALPVYSAGGVAVPWHGRYVFYSSDGARLYVVMQADSGANLINDYAVYSLTLSGGSDCAPSLGSVSSNLPASGGTAEVNVTANQGCIWQAASNVSWLSVGSGAISSGSGKVTVQASPNLQTGSRSGTITIAGLTYTVSQSAASAPGSDPVTMSPVRPIDADYSTALDRVILVSSNPDLLTIFDPLTGSGQTVALSMPPTALSVSTDGLHAAVGHDGRISYVNLVTATLERMFPVTTTVSELALGAREIYAFPLREQWQSVRVVDIGSGAETLWNWVYAGTTGGKISPNGKYLYINSLKRYDITHTLPSAFDAISNYQPRQWFSQDGTRLFSGNGRAYRLSEIESQDLQYGGTLESSGLTAVADSSVQQVTAAVASGSTSDMTIKFFSQQYLSEIGSISIPKVNVGSKSYDAHGKYLFWNAAGNRLFALIQVDQSSGSVNDYSIYNVSLNGGCNTSLGSSSNSIGSGGGTFTLNVNANSGCAWRATSNASWLTVTINRFFAGPATLSYLVDPNPTTSTRTATITVDSLTFTIIQAGGTQAQRSALSGLPFRVADAEYSSALDRIVAISSNPNRLNIYDPVAGTTTSVPLPLSANAVAVQPAGVRAAVCEDGLLTIVNLQTASIEKNLSVSLKCNDIVFAGNNYVYMSGIGGWGTLSSVNVSTGAETTGDLFYAGTNFQLNYTGDAVYTSNTGTSSGSVSRFRIAGGPLVKDYESDIYPEHQLGSRVWFTSDGRMAGDSGSIFRTGSTRDTDFIYTGTLSGFGGYGAIGAVAHSKTRHLFASIGSGNSYATPASSDGTLFLHGDKYLGLTSKMALPPMTVAGISAASHGKYIFWDSTGARAYVILQADPSAGFQNDFALYTLSPEFTPNCAVTLGASAGTASAFADTGAVAVNAAADCVWEVKSSAPWINIDSGTLGVGIGNLSYSVLATEQTTPRTGTITIGTQTFTITQSGSATPYTISGQVTKAGAGLGGVQITLTGGSGRIQTTNASGAYSIANLAPGSYIVTPSLANHTFTPPSITLNNLQSSQTASFIANVILPPTAPVVGTVSPGSGSGLQQTFTITYTDANGAADIATAFFMISSAIDAANSCFIEYNNLADTFRLMNDAGTSWSGPIAAGSGTQSNSRCTITGAGGGSVRNGNTLTVTLPITFAQTGSGQRSIYGLAIDGAGLNSGWKSVGSWNVPPNPNNKPNVIGLTPATGSGMSGTFTAVFRHPNGATGHYLGYILFLPVPNIVSFNAQGTCLIEYNRISNGMRLIDDTGTKWIGPPEGVRVSPSTAPLSNNACTVNVAGVRAVLSGTDMTVTLPVTFKTSGVTATMGTFIQESDANNNWTDFRQFGNWQVPGAGVKPGPYVRSASQSVQSGSAVVISATVGHSAGSSNLTQVHLRLNNVIVGGAPCHAIYFPTDDTIALINDAEDALVARVPFGTAISNPGGRCAIPAGATKVPGATELLLRIPLTFNTTTFAGQKNVYLTTFDKYGAVSHWLQTGTFFVQ